MATNFPGSVDTAATVGDDTHPSADEALSSTTGGPAHHSLHQNTGLAINAIEDKVGTGASTPAANSVLTGTGSGTSAWATVATAMIADDAVTQAKIADDAVGADQLASSAVVTASIVDDNVTQAKIAAGAVDTTELAADAVTGAKIEDDAVDSEHIAAGAIDTEHIGDNQVTEAKIADNAVGNDQLIASPTFTTVTATNLAGTLTTAAQANVTSVGTLTGLTASGAIVAPSGSVSAPAIQFNDADEGIYGDSGAVIIVAGDGARVSTDNSAHKPFADSAMTLGTSGRRWTTVFADNALNTSDERDKTDVADLARGLDFVKSLRAVSYKMNKRGDSETSSDVRYGFVAQEIATVLGSDAAAHAMWQSDVDEDGVERQSLGYTEFIAPMVKAIQELTVRLEALEG